MMDTNTYEPHFLLHSWLRDRDDYFLSTNAGATEIPFQRWKSFKEAFAPEFVANAVAETSKALGRRVESCIDPFGGSGTSALTCQFLNVFPITIEVNPYLADLIEAKLASYNSDALMKSVSRVFPKREPAGRRPTVSAFSSAPPTFLEPGVNGRYLFSRSVAGRIAQLRDRILALKDDDSRRLLRVLLTSNVVAHSNAIISGKGRRYRKNWQERKVSPQDLDSNFSQMITNAAYDIRRYAHRPMKDYRLVRGDARNISKYVRRTVDMAVFSPPYPNSFDYTDVYNIELWAGGYLSSSTDNRTLRMSTLRSHVQIKRDYSHPPLASSMLNKTLKQLNEVRDALWNKSIPEMVSAYFADMDKVIGGLARVLTNRGRIYMAVGDSRYAGVDIRVSKILTELAYRYNLQLVSETPFRSMRSSPQQGGQLELAETQLVLEKL
jgi:hypothetical protein